MLRSLDPSEVSDIFLDFDAGYDIEVDEYGLYIVGRQLGEASPNQSPWVLVLNSDHTLRCSTHLVFQPILGEPYGYAVSLDHNRTHLIIGGIYAVEIPLGYSLFVAALDKQDCRLSGIFQHSISSPVSGDTITFIFGKGVDVAVDETGIYVVAGITALVRPDPQGFLVIKLDSSLNLLTHRYYYLYDPGFDFASSIALHKDGVVIVGGTLVSPTGLELLRGHMRNHFLLILDKRDLSAKEQVEIFPIAAGFFAGAEIVVEEIEIYLVTVSLDYDPISMTFVRDNPYVIKYIYSGGVLKLLWASSLTPQYSYTRDDGPGDGSQPPILVDAPYSYSLSAAVGGPYLYIGGFTGPRAFPFGGSFYHGLLIALNRTDGAGLFSFRIQPGEEPISRNAWVHGVDALGDCAYLAGWSGHHRLEYVFENVKHGYPGYRETLVRFLEGRGGPDLRDDPVNQYTSSVIFDNPTDSVRYAFYGYFCPGSVMRTFTTTSVSTTTSTTETTSTAVTTSTTHTTQTNYETRTSLTTLRRTTTTYVTNTRYSTVYTTQQRLQTVTFSETVTRLFETTSTHRTVIPQVVVYTSTSIVTLPNQTPVTTVYMNSTHTVMSTVTLAREADWFSLPPWFYLPFLLLPLPLLGILLSRGRHRIIINKTQGPPHGWKPGDTPIIDDIYMTPSLLNIQKNSTVEFLNKDDEPHVVASYDGPAKHLFKSDIIQPGKKWKHKFTEPGIYYVKSMTKEYIGAVIRVAR